ncbi:hypothetical protein AALA52_08540 [Lactococcus ileimucosae]|uniref:Uncharacterized protein n=1 Tax=Lactococcus ileimucosae TaxID=2941329 RepID=A0ABV4D424_9LACT
MNTQSENVQFQATKDLLDRSERLIDKQGRDQRQEVTFYVDWDGASREDGD